MAQSRFISISSYCLVEYISEPLASPNFLTEDITLVQNSDTGLNQIYNGDGSYLKTKNIKDLSVASIGGNKFAYLDSEKSPNYINYDSKLSETSLTGYNVVYDKVRFHFISGFDFEGFKALILSVKNTQNDGTINVFSNILAAPETIDELITFNPKPIFLSDSLYDRFIDIKVPSPKNINEEYRTSATPQNTFAAKITPTDSGGHTGFIYNSPITIGVAECGKREKLDTDTATKYDVFEVTENYQSTLSQTNEFDVVGAQVQESLNGDFIEYYLTYNSGFPEDLISMLNRRNPQDDWIVIHQLSIFEQVGSAFINTSRQVIFQEDDYDEPLIFRPVLKNAGSAISMSIDLLCRLTNKRTGEQIIREASFSLLSPKKYGKSLINIPLSDEPQSQRVYNKIIKKNFEATKLFIEPTFAPGFGGDAVSELTPTKSIEYVPIFFNNNNISISNNSGLLKTSDISDEVVFGPGKLRFILSPFDNSLRFKLLNVVNSKLIPLDLNLNSAKYRLVFETDKGKVSIDNLNSDTSENLAIGEISFNIAKKQSGSIISSSLKTMYITSVGQDGAESMMYSGEWRASVDQAEVNSAISEAKAESEDRQTQEDKITELEKKISELEKDDPSKVLETPLRSFRKAATPSIVNKFGTKNPSKIKTDSSNAGKKSK